MSSNASALRVVHRSDLQFKPIVNQNPKCLSLSQIEAFNDHGFLEPFDLFDEQEIEVHRRNFDRLLTEVGDQGRDAYDIMNYHAHCRSIWDLATNPTILDHVEDLIGPDIVCWTSHYFCKLPGDSRKVPFHQDAAYWPLRPARTVTVWLAIDDVTPESGPMQFVPGSHLHGRFEWHKRTENVVLNLEVNGHDSIEHVHPLLLKAGQFSLHTDMLVHGSAPNQSTQRRCGLTLRYVPPTVWVKHSEAGKGMQNSILCRGSDPTGRWPHNDRPAGDDLSPLQY